jgi:hypothetical protein
MVGGTGSHGLMKVWSMDRARTMPLSSHIRMTMKMEKKRVLLVRLKVMVKEALV